MYLRQKHVYKPFFTNNPSLSGLDIGRLEECDVNAFMIRVLGGKCETSTRGILVEKDGAKKLQAARMAVAVCQKAEGAVPVKRRRTMRVDL